MNPALKYMRMGLLAALVGLAPASGLLADTVYLKNGRKIEASNIVRQEGKLTFDAAGGEVTVSETLVDRIESDDPGRPPIMISKPKVARSAAPSSGPAATAPEAKPQPVALQVKQRPSNLAAPRPMPAPIVRPTNGRDANVPMQPAVLVLSTQNAAEVIPEIAAPGPVSPREVSSWFLTDSSAAMFSVPRSLNASASPKASPSAGTTARPVQVGTFAPAVDLASESGAESHPKETRVVPPGTFQTVKMVPVPKPERVGVQTRQPEQGVVVLSGPHPAYTDEARSLGIEGEVLLDVVFQASGELKVNGVLQGLGHGLDDESVRAAQQIRFTPAMQQGRAVDFPATLHIVFQLGF